jgi:hypothetical protein
MPMDRERSPLVSTQLTPSRRRFLMTAPAAAVAVGAIPPTSAMGAQAGLSPELAALEQEFDAAHVAYRVISKRHDEAETLWYALEPEHPKELMHPFGGWLEDPITQTRPWSAAGLRQQAQVWHNIEAGKRTWLEAARLAQAEELIPVAEAYETVRDHAQRACNIEAVEREYYDAMKAVDEVACRLMAVPARSAADFALKVRLLREWVWPDLKDAMVEDDIRYASIARIIADALALIGGAAGNEPAA